MARVIKRAPNLAVLCGLAVNPSTPLPALLRLAEHPHHGLLAPSSALLGRDDFPPEVAKALAEHPDTGVRQRLAAHPATPEDIRCGLAEDPEPIVRAAVAAWPASWVELPSIHQVTGEPLPADVYRRLAADGEPSVRVAIALNQYAPQDVRAALAGDSDPEVRRSAALRELPPAALLRLIGDDDPEVRQTALMGAAVHAPGTTISPELAALFDNDSLYSRHTAAELVELTPPLLARLWAQPDLHVALARNPSLPAEQMRALLDNTATRVALAGNPGLPEPLLEELVATEAPDVHRQLLRRTALPDRLRRRLIVAGEADEPLPAAFSTRTAHTLEERLSYLDHPNPEFRRALALCPDLPRDAVHRLAEDPDARVRLLVCERHTDVPPAALAGVVECHNGRTRGDLLRNPSLPADAVARYATSDSAYDRLAIASRPDLPAELALRLVADSDAHVRGAAAACPNITHDGVRRLLTDPSPAVREGAASNPVLTVKDIEQLLADSY